MATTFELKRFVLSPTLEELTSLTKVNLPFDHVNKKLGQTDYWMHLLLISALLGPAMVHGPLFHMVIQMG